jgi:hypothetical protein
MVLTLVVAVMAGVHGHVAEGFFLFIAAATPFPATVAMRAGRWLCARLGKRGMSGRSCRDNAGAVLSTPAAAIAIAR